MYPVWLQNSVDGFEQEWRQLGKGMMGREDWTINGALCHLETISMCDSKK